MHPRTPSRGRSAAGLALACSLALSLTPGSAEIKDPQVREARDRLRAVNERIDAKKQRLRLLNRDLSRLATRIGSVRSRIGETRRKIERAQAHLEKTNDAFDAILAEMHERSAVAYMEGPGAPIEMILSATSYDDFLDRLGMLEAMNVRDGHLADALEALALELQTTRARLRALQEEHRTLLEELNVRERELHRKFGQQRRLLRSLAVRRADVKEDIWRMRPFASCPVDGPHAVADDFGAPRYDRRGRFDHDHQGNDIMAPTGAPIVAPFPGKAISGHDRLGGLYVKVYGQYGYVYNAHLSRLGTLGEVQTGTVIGYVGVSGNAQGPHDHFEWHPNEGPAVDPHEFLMLVC